MVQQGPQQQRVTTPTAAWAQLRGALPAAGAAQNDGERDLVAAAHALWACDPSAGAAALGQAGFDPAARDEWAPSAAAVQALRRAADAALEPPPEARELHDALEQMRPGTYHRFIDHLKQDQCDLADVCGTGATEDDSRGTLEEFYQAVNLVARPVLRQKAVAKLRAMRAPKQAADVAPRALPDLLVEPLPCAAHPFVPSCTVVCRDHKQLLCALCVAPGGPHAGCDVASLRAAAAHCNQAARGNRGADGARAGERRRPPGERMWAAVVLTAVVVAATAQRPALPHEEQHVDPAGGGAEGPAADMAYPVTTLHAGKEFGWYPSLTNANGGHFAVVGGELPEGVRLDGVTGQLHGRAREAGSWRAEVRSGTLTREVRFEVAEGTSMIATFAGDGSTDKGITADALASSMHWVHGLAADDHFLYASLLNNGLIVRLPLGGGPPQVIAGGGASDADGIPATQAKLTSPRGLALDGHTLYVCVYGEHKVRRIDLAPGGGGRIYTVAGTGDAGHGGDNGPARMGVLHHPWDVAVSDRILYFTDYGTHRVRAINLETQVITTAAGTGTAGWAGDGGRATAASLQYPRGLCVAGAALYIADYSNYCVRRVDLNNGTITTVAGRGGTAEVLGPVAAAVAKLIDPYSVAAGADGDIYIGTPGRVLRMRGGRISPVCGNGARGCGGDGGPAALGQVNLAVGMLEQQGALYVADFYNHRIRRIVPERPPRPQGWAAQEQQWERLPVAEGAGALRSPALRLTQGTMRFSVAQPPEGHCVSLRFDPSPQGAALLLGCVGGCAEGAAALLEGAGGHPMGRLRDSRERFFFRKDNAFEARVRRSEHNNGGMEYQLSGLMLNGRSVLYEQRMQVVVGPDVPVRLVLSAHPPEGAAGGAGLGLLSAPLLIEDRGN
eukprot:TRINITY_DN1032_c0_g2_i4.p1 TRINITY_DN1032_c0_g2~~TRINITY_DN1032_c0_g2_i4.p1  ORF type:complete len:929 (+),score=256.70 TRINITY_DN1032_c0_g2_i4:94-2787(+)